ncbi:RNA polymerase sigma factor SigJ [Paenibacillus sp. P25]|nr:RNA polymerase sigma factor SigJ [Paenibacillus sp. P25]
MPNGYFRIKAEQERIVEAGRVPWTIVRATQFHEFIAAILAQAGRWRVLPMPRVPLQTVSAEEVARAVADAAEAPPRHGRIEIAGPEIIDTLELARTWRSITGRRTLFLPLPLPGKLGRALRAGAATEKRPHILGTTRFAVWLKDKGKTMPDEHFDGKERSDTGLDTALLLSFEAERPRLLRVAYAIVGSVAEAEDCVQEAWLRLQRMKDPVAIRDLTAWLTTTVGRLALDALGSARARREHYVGTWSPEPLVEDTGTSDPAERVALDESVSMALMIVLERLSAAERTAFLLHDVFGLSFDEVASVVGRTPAAVRQLASRARKHVEQGRPRFAPTRAEQRELVHAFATACQEGDLEKLVSLLDPEVVWRGDGGGKVSTVPETRQGAETVARGAARIHTGSPAGSADGRGQRRSGPRAA